MNFGKSRLHAAILAAIALPAIAQARPAINPALAGIDTAEAPRVTRVVDTDAIAPVAKSHIAAIEHAVAKGDVADAMPMPHMALILQRSPQRQAALDALIADQHDPHSPRFHQWVTPEEFGTHFGVVDADIAAVTRWLTAQGFTVHNVYPNRMQIDFSGTAGAVKRAFHAQERNFTIHGESHVANASDISVPSALRGVVAGVAGLTTVHPRPSNIFQRVGHMDATTGKLKFADDGKNLKPMAVPFQGGDRGLVPFDLVKMYGVKKLHDQGITGKGMTIAVLDIEAMVPTDWTNFVSQFNLGHFGGTFLQFQPVAPGPVGTVSNCIDPTKGGAFPEDFDETYLDAEWATAIAPGAHMEVAVCSDFPQHNFFGGVFTAATNLINAQNRPDVISASYGFGENDVDSGSKAAIDLMWPQADAEGISVFVSTGDSGSNPNFNGDVIHDEGISTNALASSPHVTAVGGTDTADVLDGTTKTYFAHNLNADYGSAKSYVPEIPWNQSCGNPVGGQAFGFSSAIAFCKAVLAQDPQGNSVQAEAGSGGPSFIDAKPAWQSLVHGRANDGWRDEPDVSLFAGSFNGYTSVIVCSSFNPCAPGFPGGIETSGGTSLSSPMFAAIQLLVDQSLWQNGLPKDQGNAAPVLYALAAKEYGGPAGNPATLAQCNSDNGATGTDACVFHNVTRGGISSNCVELIGGPTTPDCFFYGKLINYFTFDDGPGNYRVGLMSTSTTSYKPAYSSQPGWSFAAGLGSVNATNLAAAWQSYITAP